MDVRTFKTKDELGAEAASSGADKIRESLAERSEVCIVMASAASQFEVVEALAREVEMEWGRITLFHLDEYIGIGPDHPASFSRFLRERFIDRLPCPLKAFHAIGGENDPHMECARVGGLLAAADPVVAFIGIGENGHIAFNDPPADFVTSAPYLVVELDGICRQQQVGEGWFPDLDAVPTHAISMSVQQILKAERIICSVPDERKADAVRKTIGGEVNPEVAATILQNHGDCTLYLDEPAASLIQR